MKDKKHFSIAFTGMSALALVLAACSSSSSSESCTFNGVPTDCSTGIPIGGSTTFNNDANASVSYDKATKTYKATKNGRTYTVSQSDFETGQTYLFDLGLIPKFEINKNFYNVVLNNGKNSDFVSMGGIGEGGVFLGSDGTKTAVGQTSGTANYSGRVSIATKSGSPFRSQMDLAMDFDAGTVKTQRGELVLDGKISGNSATGDATFAGNKGNFDAGFYGSNEFNGTATDEKNFVAVFETSK